MAEDRYNPRVSAAVGLAADVHAGQVDKAGLPYILHPVAVLAAVARDLPPDMSDHDRDALLCAAVLHDLLEDCPTQARRRLERRIYERFGNRCSQALDALTRRRDEAYMDYIGRVCGDWIARRVKIADLQHNLAPERGAALSASMRTRYQVALREVLVTDRAQQPHRVSSVGLDG